MNLKIFVVMLESYIDVICFVDTIAKIKWFLNYIKIIFKINMIYTLKERYQCRTFPKQFDEFDEDFDIDDTVSSEKQKV